MHFSVAGELTEIETIATSSGIRELPRLRKLYGRGRWRKRKGIADIRLQDGTVARAEIHCTRQLGSGVGNSRLSALFRRSSHGKSYY
jgi:hypothetical protein